MGLLVTGGSGYLGSELVRRSDAVGLGSANADVRDAAAVDRLFDVHRPDAVIHAAYRQDLAAQGLVQRRQAVVQQLDRPVIDVQIELKPHA